MEPLTPNDVSNGQNRRRMLIVRLIIFYLLFCCSILLLVSIIYLNVLREPSPTPSACFDRDGDGVCDIDDACPLHSGHPPSGCPSPNSATPTSLDLDNTPSPEPANIPPCSVVAPADSHVNIHTEPSRDAPIGGLLLAGQSAPIVAAPVFGSSNWYPISGGWVSGVAVYVNYQDCSFSILTATKAPVITIPLLPSTQPPQPELTVLPTTTPISTEIASIPLLIRSKSGDEIGNGHLKVYHDEKVSFPETTRIELKLTFDKKDITPVPFGQRTVNPADTMTPFGTLDPTLLPPTPTPRIPRYQRDAGSVEIYQLMGTSLVCLESSFSGCTVKSSRVITLEGATWSWIITPKDGIQGIQDLRLELWRLISINDSPEQVDVVWEYPFQIEVLPKNDNTLMKAVSDNLGSLIAALGTIVVALISGGYLIKKRQDETKPVKQSAETKPSIFISYSRRASAGYARILHDWLTNKGAIVFLDVDDIHAGSFSDYIQHQIMKSDFFLLLLAPETLNSEWVVKEVKYAHELNKIIIPVLINDFDLYGGEVSDDLKFIQEQQAVELLPQYVDAAIDRLSEYVGLTSKDK